MKKFVLSRLSKTFFGSLIAVSSFLPSMLATAQASDSLNSRFNNSAIETKHLQKVLDSNEHKLKFKFILNKLTEFHLPKELALIPVIESEYNNKAVSHVGAGGLWQIMPSTAKSLGITNKQRFETAPSTTAALTYFRDLHDKFGNWELVLAAYNAGDGRVQKAMHKKPGVTDVLALNLPSETKNYVLKFRHLENELKYYQV